MSICSYCFYIKLSVYIIACWPLSFIHCLSIQKNKIFLSQDGNTHSFSTSVTPYLLSIGVDSSSFSSLLRYADITLNYHKRKKIVRFLCRLCFFLCAKNCSTYLKKLALFWDALLFFSAEYTGQYFSFFFWWSQRRAQLVIEVALFFLYIRENGSIFSLHISRWFHYCASEE